MIDLPQGRYSLVYADPPWSYRQGGRGAAEHHYHTMDLYDICALDVPAICEPDAVLLMWATPPNLPEALEVIRAWGFEYKTRAFVWIKVRVGWPSVPTIGCGHYTRANAEDVLLGVRGRGLPRLSRSVSSVIMEPRGRHSAKPREVRRRIEVLYGDVPRIELFARDAADGWDVWGDEAPTAAQL